MKVTILANDHEMFEGATLPAEVNGYQITGHPDIVWVSGEELIAAGCTAACAESNTVGFYAHTIYALPLGTVIDATDEVLAAFGLVRNTPPEPDTTMEA